MSDIQEDGGTAKTLWWLSLGGGACRTLLSQLSITDLYRLQSCLHSGVSTTFLRKDNKGTSAARGGSSYAWRVTKGSTWWQRWQTLSL